MYAVQNKLCTFCFTAWQSCRTSLYFSMGIANMRYANHTTVVLLSMLSAESNAAGTSTQCHHVCSSNNNVMPSVLASYVHDQSRSTTAHILSTSRAAVSMICTVLRRTALYAGAQASDASVCVPLIWSPAAHLVQTSSLALVTPIANSELHTQVHFSTACKHAQQV